MPATAKEIREKRAPLAKQIRDMADKSDGRDFTAEETEVWARVNKEYDSCSRQIEIAERAEAIEADQKRRIGDPAIGRGDFKGGDGASGEITEEDRALAIQAWAAAPLERDLTDEQQDACERLKFNPRKRQLVIPSYRTAEARRIQRVFRTTNPTQAQEACRELKDLRASTLTTGLGSLGGALIPSETLVRNLEINMLAYGGMRQVAETIVTSTGERMPWPTADDTSNTGEQIGESSDTSSSTANPSFGKVYWDAYKFSSKMIKVPFELLEDSAFNLVAVIGQMLGERLGRITNTKYTTAQGNNTAKGIVTAASSFSAASATALAADDLIGLVHSIDPAYRTSDCGFMLHDSIMLIIRKLKDSTGQYLWQTGLQSGVPDRLLGYPLTNNQDMDSTVASGKKSVLFGRLSNYKIRRVGGYRLKRLDERYAEYDQIAFLALIREDGNLLTAGTAPVKYLSH